MGTNANDGVTYTIVSEDKEETKKTKKWKEVMCFRRK